MGDFIMFMKKILLIPIFIMLVSCDSENGSENPSDNIGANALSVGDEFLGFEGLIICENENISYSYEDTTKVILLSLFASWCGTCQGHAPVLEALHQQYYEQGLIVISSGKDMGNPYSCETWKTEFGVNFLITDDNDGSVEQQFSKDGQVPYHVIIDKNRIVRYSSSGYNQNIIESLIQTTLAE